MQWITFNLKSCTHCGVKFIQQCVMLACHNDVIRINQCNHFVVTVAFVIQAYIWFAACKPYTDHECINIWCQSRDACLSPQRALCSSSTYSLSASSMRMMYFGIFIHIYICSLNIPFRNAVFTSRYRYLKPSAVPRLSSSLKVGSRATGENVSSEVDTLLLSESFRTQPSIVFLHVVCLVDLHLENYFLIHKFSSSWHFTLLGDMPRLLVDEWLHLTIDSFKPFLFHSSPLRLLRTYRCCSSHHLSRWTHQTQVPTAPL